MAIRIGTQSLGGDNIRLDGGSPTNVYFGLAGGDKVIGFGADDYIFGGRGDDDLTGGSGNDRILSGGGRDQAFGGAGDDVVSGHGGLTFDERFTIPSYDPDRDVLDGGTGNDRVIVGQGDVSRGGTGYDTLVATVGTTASQLTYTLDFRDIDGRKSSDFGWGTSTAREFERVDVIVRFAGPLTEVRGTAGDDRIEVQTNGEFRNNVFVTGSRIYGEAGDDVLLGSTSGNDSMYGGVGDDLIDSDLGSDILFGGGGGDIFFQRIRPVDPLGGGGTQPDVIRDFDPSRDMFLLELYGLTPIPLNATPLVKGAAPAAREAGGQFVYDTSDGRLFYDTDGAGVAAMVHVATFSGRPNITAANLVADNNLFLPMLDVSSEASTGNVTQRAGGTGIDKFKGTKNPDHFWGQSGRDKLSGKAGDDLLFGGRDNDKLFGGDGRDRLVGGFGADSISGGDGNDFIGAESGDFSEFTTINSLVDVLSGGGGDDLIVADMRDRVDGGAGIDRLQVRIDGSLLSNPNASVVIDFSRVDGSAAVTLADGLVVKGIEAVDVSIRNFFGGSTLIGSNGDDTLRVGPVFGGPALGVVVNGGGGDDTLFGTYLADRLLGGTGDDTIHLAEGDTVTGGAGADTFLFTIGAGDTNSHITDFAAGDAIVVVYNGQFNGVVGNPNPITLVSGSNPIADLPGQAQFLFDTPTRTLSIDYNGSDPGGAFIIGTVQGPATPSAGNLALEFLVA